GPGSARTGRLAGAPGRRRPRRGVLRLSIGAAEPAHAAIAAGAAGRQAPGGSAPAPAGPDRGPEHHDPVRQPRPPVLRRTDRNLSARATAFRPHEHLLDLPDSRPAGATPLNPQAPGGRAPLLPGAAVKTPMRRNFW